MSPFDRMPRVRETSPEPFLLPMPFQLRPACGDVIVGKPTLFGQRSQFYTRLVLWNIHWHPFTHKSTSSTP